MAEIKITKANFEEEVLHSDIPVLVDFWAEWCAPCRMLAPAVAQIAEEYAGRVKVGKVNVDEEGELAMQYRVASIPMLVFFKKGEAVRKMIGLCSKTQIENMIL